MFDVKTRGAKVPLHEQMYRVIRERIDSSEWGPGYQLPTEGELAAEFDVSRGTTRQAITRLVSEGAVERTAGRGTFVSQSRFVYPLADLLGFTEQISQRGQHPSSRLLTASSVPVATAHSLFDFGDKVTDLLSVQRVRNADDEPVALEELLLPLPRFAGLKDVDLEHSSIYEALEDHFGVRIRVGEFNLDVTALNEYQAQLLDEHSGAPAFLMTGSVFDQDGRTVAGVRSYYRRDRYTFHFSMPRRHTSRDGVPQLIMTAGSA